MKYCKFCCAELEISTFYQNVYPPPWAPSNHPVFCCCIATGCPRAAATWVAVGITPGGGGWNKHTI